MVDYSCTRVELEAREVCPLPERPGIWQAPAETARKTRQYGLSSERFEFLRSLGQDSILGYRVLLETISKEVHNKLESLACQAREGKNVMEAADFARWLQFSGVLTLLERYALADQDFTLVRRAVTELLSECGEQFRGGRVAPKYSESDIRAIKNDINEIRACLARKTTVTVVTTSPVERLSLRDV